MTKLIFIIAAATLTASAHGQQRLLTTAVKQQLQNALSNKAGNPLFEGSTWKLTERFCASSMSETDWASPAKVFDISTYHQTWTFENGRQTFLIHNATFDANKCATRVDGIYGYVDIESAEPINGVLATTTTQRLRIDCATTYPGPLLGLMHILSWSDTTHTEFRVMTLATSIAPTPVVCPNEGDYLITKWKKYQPAP